MNLTHDNSAKNHSRLFDKTTQAEITNFARRTYNTDVFNVFTCTTGGAPFSAVDCSELCTVVFVQTLVGSCPDCDKVELIVDETNSFFVDVVEECVTLDDIFVSTWLSLPPSWYVFSLEKCFSLVLAGCMISANCGTNSSTFSTSPAATCFADSLSESWTSYVNKADTFFCR